MFDPKPRKPPPQAEMALVYRALLEHGPAVRVSALAAALGRRHVGATGRTLRALVAEGMASCQEMRDEPAMYRVYTAMAIERKLVPAEWLVRTALRCFERGLMSSRGGWTQVGTASARKAWAACPERAGLVELLGLNRVETEEAKDLAEQEAL